MGLNHASNDSEKSANKRNIEGEKDPWDVVARPERGHRKSLSGSLSSLSFLRSHSSAGHGSEPASPSKAFMDQPVDSPSSPTMPVVDPKTMRRRKGSLRKTAILGTGKLRMNNGVRRGSSSSIERAASSLEEGASSLEEAGNPEGRMQDKLAAEYSPQAAQHGLATPLDMSTPRPLLVPPPVPMVTHPVHGDPSKISASSNETRSFPTGLQRPGTAQSTASTTDDDDSPTSPTHPLLQIKPLLSTDSYFPPQPRTLPRPRPTTPQSRSPLATLPPSLPSSSPSEWDYSETRWWGWLILAVTWIVFVVGMGSCFEVWSWAWDVGETPYAPPELEDDPTLPIVGYYPALIILTTVMAWVWVTIAWVGMKYFKHANISGDED